MAWIEFQRDRAQYFATAMIYYAIVSLVPLLSLLLSIVGLLLGYSAEAAEFHRQTVSRLEAAFGAQMREMAEPLIANLEQKSITATLSVLPDFSWPLRFCFIIYE